MSDTIAVSIMMTLHTGSFYGLEANYGLVHPQGKKSYKEYMRIITGFGLEPGYHKRILNFMYGKTETQRQVSPHPHSHPHTASPCRCEIRTSGLHCYLLQMPRKPNGSLSCHSGGPDPSLKYDVTFFSTQGPGQNENDLINM